jgi:aspartate/methionine/tyrosine aminotransferase
MSNSRKQPITPSGLDCTPKTKLLLLNSPGNPTGRIFPKAEFEAIGRVCAKHGITVVSDEIYRAFSYAPTTSMAEVYPDTWSWSGTPRPSA